MTPLSQPTIDVERFVEQTIRRVNSDRYSHRIGEPFALLSQDTPLLETMLRHVIERSLMFTNDTLRTIGGDSQHTAEVTAQDVSHTLAFLTVVEHPDVVYPDATDLEPNAKAIRLLLGWFAQQGEHVLYDVLHSLQRVQDAPDRLDWIEDYVGLPSEYEQYDHRALQYYLMYAVCAGLEATVDLHPEQPWAWREPLVIQHIVASLRTPDQDAYGGAYDNAIVDVDRMIEDDLSRQYDSFQTFHWRM